MGRKYNKSPIVEALCEFSFKPGPEWDITFPGLFYEKVSKKFPKRRAAKKIESKGAPEKEGFQLQYQIINFIQFLREDEKALVQVAKDHLSVNFLEPYPSWAEFRPVIIENLEEYRKLAKPAGVQRIGLRYINRVEFEPKRAELEDYFDFYPYLGSKLPQDHGAFIVGVQVPYEGRRDLLKIELKSAKAEQPNILSMLLDLQYFLNKPDDVTLDQIGGWLEVAHRHVEETFEACITDKLRQTFEEEA